MGRLDRRRRPSGREGAGSGRTWSQRASISSATNMASAVCTPCPISARGMATVTELSRATFTQPLSPASPGLTFNRSRRPMPSGSPASE